MENNQLYFDLIITDKEGTHRAGLVEFKGDELVKPNEKYTSRFDGKTVMLSTTELEGEKLRETPTFYVVSGTYDQLLEESPLITADLKKGGPYLVKMNFNSDKLKAIDGLLKKLSICYASSQAMAKDLLDAKYSKS